MKLQYYVMADVIIKGWISKSPASSDLNTPINSDSNLPIRKGTIRMSRDAYIALKFSYFAGSYLAVVYLSVLFASQEQVLGLYPRHPTIFCHNDAIESLTETGSQEPQDWCRTYCMYLTMKCACSKCLTFHMKQRHRMKR